MFTHPRMRIALIAVLTTLVALLALASSALAQAPTGEVEIVGEITSIEGGPSLALSGLGVAYSAGAPVITVNGLRVDIAGAELYVPIQVGAAVKVEGTLQPDGTIVAREVKAAEEDGLLPGESEFIGTLTGLSATTATVNGLIFDIASAEIEPGLAVGMVVEVHARLSDGGVWVAREIERFVPEVSGTPEGHMPIPVGAECTECHETQPAVAAPGGLVKVDDDGLEIIGTLDEIGENYVVVAGQRYDTTGAEMKGALVVGTLVKIELTRLDSGILVAHEVKPAPFVDMDEEDMDDDGDDDSDDGDSDDSDSCEFEVEVSSASLRSGPGTRYDVIGYAFDGDKLSVLAVDATGTWVKVATTGGEVWIAVSVGELEDDCDGLAVTDDPFKDDDDDDDDDDGDDDSGDDDGDDSGDDDDDDGDDHGDDSGDDDDDHGDDGDEDEEEHEEEEEEGD